VATTAAAAAAADDDDDEDIELYVNIINIMMKV